MMAVNWTEGLLTGYGLYDQLDRYSNLSDKLVTGTNQLADQALAGTQFKPFTVRTNEGTAAIGANGDVTLSQNPYMDAMTGMLGGGAYNLYNQALAPTAQRESQVYNAIRATQTPEEQRAALAMENRLNAQGRSGITSAQYGGTPEQLAYHKAVQEAQNNASLMSIQQAKSDQLQNAQLGSAFFNDYFLPQNQLLNASNLGLQAANMAQAGQLGGQSLASQLGLAGLQGSLNADVARGELINSMFGLAGNAAGAGGFDPIGDIGSSLWDAIKGIFT
jgi:hypothetical protein